MSASQKERLYVKGLDGEITRVYVESEEELKDMPVEELKRRICCDSEEIPILGCRLMFRGLQLEDQDTLGQHGIKSGCTVHWTGRLCGGQKLEDEDKGVSKTESMECLELMRQTDLESDLS